MNSEPHRTAEGFLQTVRAVKAPSVYLPQKSADRYGRPTITEWSNGASAEISSLYIQLLILAAVILPRPLTQMYKQLCITGAKGARAVRELVNVGLVLVHTFPTGKRGGGIRILQVTEAGWNKLSEYRVKRPKTLTRGGWAHNLIAAALGTLGTGQGFRVAYEVVVGDLRMDVRWQSPTGKLMFFQIALSRADREVEAVIKAMKVPAVAAG